MPYCRRCLAHVQEARAVGSFGFLFDEIAFAFLLFFLVPAIAFGPPAFLFALLVMMSQRGIGAASVAGIGVVGAFSLAAAGIAAVVIYARHKRTKRESIKRREAAMQRAESLMQDACSAMGPAVVYDGWFGSIHAFFFENEQYAAAFVQTNQGKVVM